MIGALLFRFGCLYALTILGGMIYFNECLTPLKVISTGRM